MKRGGLIDRFPLHLFLPAQERRPVVIVDDEALGLPQTTPPGCEAGAIVISPDESLLRETQREVRGAVNLNLVRCDPNNLPFADGSIGSYIVRETRPGPCRNSPPEEQLARTLPSNGAVVLIRRMAQRPPASRSEIALGGRHLDRFHVRPEVGANYFVTREWVPKAWPFGALHRGFLKTLAMRLNLAVSRLRIRWLFKGAEIIIHSRESLLVRIEDEIVNACRSARNSGGTFTHPVFIKPEASAIFVEPTSNGLVVKLPLNRGYTERLERHLKNVADLSANPPTGLKGVIPEVVTNGICHGQPYSAETLVEGLNGERFRWNPTKRRRVTEAAFDVILNLHLSSRCPRPIDERWVGDSLRPEIQALTARSRELGLPFEFDPLLRALGGFFTDQDVPLVRTHGDFWQGNLLFTPECTVAAVLDWDESQSRSWPVLDVLHLLAFSRKWEATHAFQKLVMRRLLQRRFTRWERGLVQDYFGKLDIQEDLWPGFVALYWVKQGYMRLEHWGPSEFQRSVTQVLPELTQVVTSSVPTEWARK